MKQISNLLLVLLLGMAVSALPAHGSEDEHQHEPAEEQARTTLSDHAIAAANITTENVGSQTLNLSETLFGVVAPVNTKQVTISATYPGQIIALNVNVGDKVTKGQTLLRVRNAASGNEYNVFSPIAGEITARLANPGEFADRQPLLEVTDLSEVWVELSAFPEAIEKLELNQKAYVYDLHQHQIAEGKISYIAPQMTGGHIARARLQIANPEGHWRPGMHVKANVITDQVDVPLAVARDAVQTLHENPVVFARFGNTFEARTLELGREDGQYIEVLSGINANTPYVVTNSYLLKADILKHGASHDH